MRARAQYSIHYKTKTRGRRPDSAPLACLTSRALVQLKEMDMKEIRGFGLGSVLVVRQPRGCWLAGVGLLAGWLYWAVVSSFGHGRVWKRSQQLPGGLPACPSRGVCQKCLSEVHQRCPVREMRLTLSPHRAAGALQAGGMHCTWPLLGTPARTPSSVRGPNGRYKDRLPCPASLPIRHSTAHSALLSSHSADASSPAAATTNRGKRRIINFHGPLSDSTSPPTPASKSSHWPDPPPLPLSFRPRCQSWPCP
ncbi:hypothetical protein CDD81_7787 [Ophiocordyceps australis]|uniref:Uncharacterized protein n=1 Tax=Ophiocordyceps australis TaxID=1399860 RepID=A0A2C5X8W0_9HYPO|nr:hypothetical protein CDD81_7787 [Ophiocordyceps australis]